MSSSKTVSTMFPPEVREALIKAANTEGTDRQRTIAIEKATRLARNTKPTLFKKEEEHHENQTYECPTFLPRPVRGKDRQR